MIMTLHARPIPKIILLGLTALSVLPAVASAKPLSYNFIEADYLSANPGDADGFDVAGSFAINPNFFAAAGYGELKDSGVKLKTFDVGLGGHAPVAENVDVFGVVSYVHAKVEVGSASGSEDGYGVQAGLRGMVMDALELNGAISYVDLGSNIDETAFSIGAVYDFTDAIAGTVGYVNGEDDAETWNVGLRFNF